MSKAILTILLVLACNTSMADWASLGSDETSTHYIDFSSIRWSEHTAKVWVLWDFKLFPEWDSSKSVMSAKQQFEYNCKEKTARMLYFSTHSKNMGRGEVISFSSAVTEWTPVPPDSVADIFMSYACMPQPVKKKK